jgi:hypothetical protein
MDCHLRPSVVEGKGQRAKILSYVNIFFRAVKEKVRCIWYLCCLKEPAFEYLVNGHCEPTFNPVTPYKYNFTSISCDPHRGLIYSAVPTRKEEGFSAKKDKK